MDSNGALRLAAGHLSPMTEMRRPRNPHRAHTPCASSRRRHRKLPGYGPARAHHTFPMESWPI